MATEKVHIPQAAMRKPLSLANSELVPTVYLSRCKAYMGASMEKLYTSSLEGECVVFAIRHPTQLNVIFL